MTNRELIKILFDQDLDMEVYRSGGSDPKANLRISSVRVGKTYRVDKDILILD